jgi:hypothetical protein
VFIGLSFPEPEVKLVLVLIISRCPFPKALTSLSDAVLETYKGNFQGIGEVSIYPMIEQGREGGWKFKCHDEGIQRRA